MLGAGPLMQPHQLRRTRRIGGTNLVRGLEQLVADHQVVFASQLVAHLLDGVAHATRVLRPREIGRGLVAKWSNLGAGLRARRNDGSHRDESFRCGECAPRRVPGAASNLPFYTPDSEEMKTEGRRGRGGMRVRWTDPFPHFPFPVRGRMWHPSGFLQLVDEAAALTDIRSRTAARIFRREGNTPRNAAAPASTTNAPSTRTLNSPYCPLTISTSAWSSRRSCAATRTACNPVTQYAQ